ncbi:S24 family peptidase [Sulfurimonas sp. HSL-1656]|uniref:S24 family peptidase n=1 Tax=Thiomicrolovo subterrani TaxID=3131934 RepID=UPI0031F7D9DD
MTPEKKVAALLDDYGRGGKTKLAKFLDVPPVYITRWVGEQYVDYSIPKEYIANIEKFFNKPPGFLLSSEHMSEVSLIPVVGTADCGGGDVNHLQDRSRVCYYNGEYYSDKLYCVIASGDSMSTFIDNGDEVICDPTVVPESGDIVHYRIGNESAIKVFVFDQEANMVQFVPINSSDTFKTKTIRLDTEGDIFDELFMAKVVAVNKLCFSNRSAILKMIGR